MTLMRETGLVSLDPASYEPGSPYGIITADCSSPREIDDGLSVEMLDADKETYQVSVCVADTSKLYGNPEIRRQAFENVAARYDNGAEIDYVPMIDQSAIKQTEFSRGRVKRALILSFLVGEEQPPSQLDVAFGRVEVLRNLDYKRFGNKCRYSPDYTKFGRASTFIMHHLGYSPGGDRDAVLAAKAEGRTRDLYNSVIHVPSRKMWQRGAMLNESFMIAANHLVGKQFMEEELPAIYRVHDPADTTYAEFISPTKARYSQQPGLHVGLGLRPYCRVTSPLRRLEDFVMSYHLRVRHEGQPVSDNDRAHVALAVRNLNQEVSNQAPNYRGLNTRDLLGNHALRHLSIAAA